MIIDYKQKLFSDYSLKPILLLFISFQLVAICTLTYYYDYHFTYDDYNTARISMLKSREIIKVLSYEQNFPIFYLFLHSLESLKFNLVNFKYLHFLIWGMSLFIFKKVVYKIIKNKTIALFTLALYVYSANIWMLAYRMRMYTLIIFLNLIVINLLTNLSHNYSIKSKLIVGIAFISCLLHPTGIILAFLVSISLVLNKKYIKLAGTVLIICSLAIFINIVPLKENFIEIYLNGTSYLMNPSYGFKATANAVLFGFDYNNEPYIAIVLLLVTLNSIKKMVIGKDVVNNYITFGMIMVLFFATASEFGNFHLAGHHLTYLTIPTILFIGKSVSLQNKKAKYLQISIIFFAFVAQNNITLSTIYQEQSNGHKLCSYLSSHPGKTIITDFATYNVINYCQTGKPEKILLVGQLGTTPISNTNLYGQLIIQAKQGGFITPYHVVAFAELLSNNPELHNKIKQDIELFLNGNSQFYYIMSYGVHQKNFISTYELEWFQNYTLKDYSPPSIMTFSNNHY